MSKRFTNKIYSTIIALGFKEHFAPTPVIANDRIVGSVWHYYNARTKVFLDYNWYHDKFHAFRC